MVDEPRSVKSRKSRRAKSESVPDPFAFLAEASTILASSLDYETTLASVARLAVPTLGDCCVVEVVDETSAIRRVAAVHVDPSKEGLLLELLDFHPLRDYSSRARSTSLSGGKTRLVPEVSASLLELLFGAEERRLQAVRELGPRSFMLVPLVARGRALGHIGLAVTESDRRYGPADQFLAEELARRAALAVDNAFLYQAESRARAAAEAERRRAEELAAEAQRLAAERGEHLARLNTLIRASQEVLEQTTVEGLLQHVADAARELTRARSVVAGHGRRAGAFAVGAPSTRGGKIVCPLGDELVTERGGVHHELLRDKVSFRYTDEELRSHPDWWGLPDGHLPVRGLLGARLGGIDGFPAGMIMASDREQGDFTAEDEALLRQLAALASLGLKHIEARTQAEEHAGELDAIFTAMSDIVLVYEPGGTVMRANPAATAAYGFDPVGLSWQEIVARLSMTYADGRPIAACDLPVCRALEGRTTTQERYAFVDAAGRTVTVLVSASPLLSRGAIAGAVIVWHDVTERENLLREVNDRRRLFLTVVDNVPAAVCLLRGPDFVHELVNPTFRAIAHGRDVLGKPFAAVWPEMAEGVRPILERVLRTGEAYHAADQWYRVRRVPDGRIENVCLTLSVVRIGLPGDESPSVLVAFNETTEQARARNQIEELAEVAQRRAAELVAILDNMVDGVFVCDADGRVTLTNKAGVRLLGLGSEEEALRPMAELLKHPQRRCPDGQPLPLDDTPLARALQGETVLDQDEMFCHPMTGQQTFVRTSAAPIRDSDGKVSGAVAVARNVTELTELDRLKDQFIAVAAHELKTPLAIMKGYAQVLLQSAGDMPGPRRRMLDAINRGADRIDAVVMDLLDISRVLQGQLELTLDRLELVGLVSEVADRLAMTTRKHRIRVGPSEPAIVWGDRDRLEQVLANLIDNAVRYSPTGGDVDLAVEVRGCEAIVSVKDQGIGIPKDRQRRIFQRFYRAHTLTPYDYGGMGVGLYISREIARRHGGRMWFESEEGKGSAFYVSLPLYDPSAPRR